MADLDLNLDRHAVIEASAGTGKTHTLEQLVLRLLRDKGGKLDEILLVTYTEKAAGELKDRLRRCLEKAGLQSALDTFDQANVYTIHGFCQRVLQEFAFENREDFRPQLVHDEELLESCLREMQRRQWREEFGRRLPLVLELAGYATPGAGPKWEKLVQDLALRVRPGCGHELRPVSGKDWLAELERMESAIRQAIPELRRKAGMAGKAASGNIEKHPWNVGFAGLRSQYKEQRRKNVLVPLLHWLGDPDAEAQPVQSFFRLLAHCAAEEKLFNRDGFSVLTKLTKQDEANLPAACPRLIETAADLEKLRAACNPDELAGKLIVHTVHNLQDHLSGTKRERSMQSFEDMLTRVDEALQGESRRAAVLLAALRERFRYAVVDEFQDTDLIQWRIFKRIFVESETGHRLFVVGDPKQAIYGFRGGDVETYVQARDDLKHKYGADIHELDENWRSSPDLLVALNRLFNKGRWFPGPDITYSDVKPPPQEKQQNVLVDDQTNRAALTLVDLTHCKRLADARRDMAKFIVSEIARVLAGKNGKPTMVRVKNAADRALQAGDICILVANRRSDAFPVIDALREAGIAFTFYKQPGLWEADEVVHLEYILRALARPEDVAGFRKALLTCFYRIPAQRLAGTDFPQEHAVAERFQQWRELAEQRRWAELFQSLLEDTGVLFAGPSSDIERSLANYRHIFLTLQQEAYGKDLDLFGLLESLRELRRQVGTDETDVQPMETDQPKVKVMTIHAAKGLESAVVFLAGGFTSGRGADWTSYRDPADKHVIFHLCPDSEAEKLARQERDAEDRRLLYVALTRAMFKLYVPLLLDDPKYRYPGPAIKILAPAIASAGLDSEQSEHVETANVKQQPGVRGLVPAATLPAPRAKPQAAAIQVGELFPQLDANLPQRRITVRSFSSLHRSAMAAGALAASVDRLSRGDDDARDSLEEEQVLRGPVFGEMVHAVLETIDFAAVHAAVDPGALLEVRTATRELIDAQIQLHLAEFPARGEEELAEACRQLIARLVYKALRTPLKELGGPLAGIAVEDRLHELEFDFPESETAPAEVWRQDRFLTGIIDLVVRRDRRFFLVDWKTNYLPGTYSPDELKQSMQDSDYHRQYRLYLQALARWLKRVHGKTVDPARDFGGVYYLYLRGMNGKDESNGVYFHQPTRDDLRLERVLGE